MKVKHIQPWLSLVLGLASIVILTQVIIAISHWSQYLSPVITALFLGVLIQPVLKRSVTLQIGVDLSYKHALKFAIACIGAGISVQTLLDLGLSFILLLLFVVGSTLIILYWFGNLLRIGEETRILIATGNAICGGTAIAATAPIIGAKAQAVSVAISVIFLFNLSSLILFPYVQSILLLPDELYGKWVGLSIHDTSSVLAASFAVSEEAGAAAAIVKVGRIACLGLVLLGLSLWLKYKGRGDNQGEGTRDSRITNLIPWYVLVFGLFMLVNSFELLPELLLSAVYNLGTWLIIAGIFALAANISLTNIKAAGWRPIALGFIGWVYLSLVSFILLMLLY